MQYMATVAEHKANNIHLQGDKTSFVQMRNERDATLNMPTLIFQSVQTNMRAGKMPPAEENGIRYLKIPVNAV